MAKDALGHGSDARGSHSEGIQKATRRYHVVVSPYSLAAGKVGHPTGSEQIVSTHDSLNAAGNKAGSMISGKMRGSAEKLSGQGNGYHLFIRDTATGREYSRRDAKDISRGVQAEGTSFLSPRIKR
jgi:hypothetical protein